MERNVKIEIESIGKDGVNENPDSGYAQDYKLCDSRTLKETLKPLFLSMRIMGLVYGDAFQASCVKSNAVGCYDETLEHKIEHQASKKKHRPMRCRNLFGFYYSVFIGAVLLLIISHGMYEISETRDTLGLMTRTFLFIWVILCTCQHSLCAYITSYRSKKNPSNRFDKFVRAMMLVREESVLKTKQRVLYNVTFGWFYMMINAVVVWVGASYQHLNILGLYIGESDWARSHSIKLTYAYSFAILVMVGAWAIPTCFYISLCFVVGGCFDDLLDRASATILEKKEINLENLWREYVRLCNVLSALNDLLSPLGMVMFSIYMPLICLNMNVCIKTFERDSVINQAAYIAWILMNSSILCIISLYGAWVNESASRLSEILCKINIRELDIESKLELMLLLKNVTTNNASLTVGGVVTITKGMILTIFGTIIGYLTVIMQFK